MKNINATIGVITIAVGLLLATGAWAADITVEPATGDGFVVTDAAGSAERFRVLETGEVYIGGLTVTRDEEDVPLCFDSATGRIGNCPPPPVHQGDVIIAGAQGGTCIGVATDTVPVTCNIAMGQTTKSVVVMADSANSAGLYIHADGYFVGDNNIDVVIYGQAGGTVSIGVAWIAAVY